MNNTIEQTKMDAAAGRTIVMTDGLHLCQEMLSADILGRKILSWDYDQPNDTAYLVLEREEVPGLPVIHLVGRDALRLGDWESRLAALDALPSRVMKHLSQVEKLVAWFAGHLTGRLGVQKGGAA